MGSCTAEVGENRGFKSFLSKGLRVIESGRRFAQNLKALFGKGLRIFSRKGYCNFLLVYCNINLIRANEPRKLNMIRVLKSCGLNINKSL